jgi:transposase
MGRRKFTPEFKLEAVKLVRERGVTVRQAAADLGLHENVLRKWVKDAREHGGQAFPGQGRMRADDAEVARLRRELAKTKAERDILKKPSSTLRRNHGEVRVHREAPRGMANTGSVRGARCLADVPPFLSSARV